MRLHQRGERIGERDDAHDHGLEEVVELFGIHILDRTGRRAPGIVDEDVDATKRMVHGLQHLVDEMGIGEVCHHIIRLAAGSLDGFDIGLQLVLGASADQHMHTFCGERFGDAEAEAARCGENESALAGNTEIHDGVLV